MPVGGYPGVGPSGQGPDAGHSIDRGQPADCRQAQSDRVNGVGPDANLPVGQNHTQSIRQFRPPQLWKSHQQIRIPDRDEPAPSIAVPRANGPHPRATEGTLVVIGNNNRLNRHRHIQSIGRPC